MLVKIIDNIQQFDQVKSNWDEVYSADPDSTIFVSWGWLRGWIDTKSCDWSVLAFQPDSKTPYVAFMALGMQFKNEGAFRRLFSGGAGHPGADNTGFVCLPEYADKAIPAFAGFVQKHIKWDMFDLRSVSDSRLDLFLKCFSRKSFYVQEDKNNSCPYIMLPDNWDKYLKEFIGSETRRTLKRYTKKIESNRDFRVTHAQEDTLETHIDALLWVWQERFGQKSEVILNRYRAIYRRCFENDCLFLAIFWDTTIPVTGQAAFLDQKKKIITCVTTGFNDKYAGFRPGNVMMGYVIRYAIENGLRICDLGEGAEEYKFLYGAIERFNRNVRISPKTLLGNLKKRVPVKVKKLMRDVYNKSIKRYLTQT